MALGQAEAAFRFGKGERFLGGAEAEVEWRAADDRAAGGVDDFLTPGRRPALLHRFRQGALVSLGERAAQQGAENPVNQPARTTLDQRQGGRDQRVVGDLERDPLRQREAEHHPRLGIVGQRLPGGAVDQAVEQGQAAQRLAGDRQGKALVGGVELQPLARRIHRLPTTDHAVEDAQGGAAGIHPCFGPSWLRRLQRPSPWSCRVQSINMPPAYLSKSPPVPEPEPAEPAPPPSGDKPRLDPTRYGDWEKKGIAMGFLMPFEA